MDPYKVLGVSSTASDEEIKQAYRELARNTTLTDTSTTLGRLAQEKMKQINEAYDVIMKTEAAAGTGAIPSPAGEGTAAGAPATRRSIPRSAR
jgi:DnaJ-class molecular chaperone